MNWLLLASLCLCHKTEGKPSASARIANLLKQRLENTFTVELSGCSGSVIAPQWILTAAHCMPEWQWKEVRTNDNGDKEWGEEDLSGGTLATVSRPKDSDVPEEDQWVERPDERGDDETATFDVERVVVNGGFQGEALSWKGSDLALLKVSTPMSSSMSQICLPAEDFDEFNHSNTFNAGYGRREVPHCMTDGSGPETYETCGRPVPCSKQHRTRRCGLQFLYNGTTHDKCLFEETPSASDPSCKALHSGWPDLASSTKPVHIVKGKAGRERYVTTCYQAKPTTKGWCTTREPGVDENEEPGHNSGWGFCSNDPSLVNCNRGISERVDTTPARTGILSEEFCKEKLAANLKVEQPEAKAEDYEELFDKNNVFCIGRNYSRDIEEDDLVYRLASSGKYEQIEEISEKLKSTIYSHSPRNRFDVNGGPSCFGDSGGPLFRLVTDPKTDKIVPVQIGVFSFVLWGTCQGVAEPGYYVRLKALRDWISKYVPESEVCWYGKEFSPPSLANRTSNLSKRSNKDF